MNKCIKQIVLAILILTQTSPAQPVTISRPTAVGGAIVGGIASGALGYGIFSFLEKIYDKAHKNIPLSPQDHAQGKQILQEIGAELAQTDNFEAMEQKPSVTSYCSLKRKFLRATFILTLSILGSGFTFIFLDGYTNAGRRYFAEKVIAKMDKDELLALIADNENWHDDPAILNQIYIKFGAKTPMTKLKKHVDLLLSQVTTAGAGLKAIHNSQSEALDDNASIEDLDEKVQEKLTTLREASGFLAKSTGFAQEALAGAEESEARRRTIANVQKFGSTARTAVRLGQKYLK